jgi:hypothetical protein
MSNTKQEASEKTEKKTQDSRFKSEKSGKKFEKAFKGATGGNPYPTDFAKGDDCPKDLLDAAISVGAVKK